MGHALEGTAVVTGTVAVGLSAIIGLTAIPGQVAPTYLRTYSLGGTLEIVGTVGTPQGTGFTGGPPGFTVGGGFVISPSSAGMTIPLSYLALNTRGTVWFAATGVTQLVQYIQHRTEDYS